MVGRFNRLNFLRQQDRLPGQLSLVLKREQRAVDEPAGSSCLLTEEVFFSVPEP